MSAEFIPFGVRPEYDPERAKHSPVVRECTEDLARLLYNFSSKPTSFEQTSTNGFSMVRRQFEYLETPDNDAGTIWETNIELAHVIDATSPQTDSYCVAIKRRILDGKSSRRPIDWSYAIEDYGDVGGVHGYIVEFDASTARPSMDSRAMNEYDFQVLSQELTTLRGWQDGGAAEEKVVTKRQRDEDWRSRYEKDLW